MWTVFFSSQFLVMIILVNFLISIVTQSIEEVKDQAIVKRYTYLANLNKEYLTLLYSLRLKTPQRCETCVISTNPASTTPDRWTGFLQTVKTLIKNENVQIKESIRNVRQEVRAELVSCNKQITEVKSLAAGMMHNFNV